MDGDDWRKYGLLIWPGACEEMEVFYVSCRLRIEPRGSCIRHTLYPWAVSLAHFSLLWVARLALLRDHWGQFWWHGDPQKHAVLGTGSDMLSATCATDLTSKYVFLVSKCHWKAQSLLFKNCILTLIPLLCNHQIHWNLKWIRSSRGQRAFWRLWACKEQH